MSVIVPLYKGEKYIDRIIDLIENNMDINCLQTEIIFVNDYPYDFFNDEDYSSKVKINFLNHKENKGIHQTKIDGVKIARGKYILFLDQDDTIANNYFYDQLKKIKNYDAIFCNGYHRQNELIYISNKMENSNFKLENYMNLGYPLISLGQMLIKRKAIPKGWIENTMTSNGWDDHLFWICMLQEKLSITYNNNNLYIHEEDGNNASFNWIEMKNSAMEFEKIIDNLKIFDKKQYTEFIIKIEERIRKYNKYIELDKLLQNITKQEVNDYLCKNSIYSIAVYGIGIYGKRFCQMIDPRRICIKYGIDKNAAKKKADFPIYEKIRGDIHIDCIICATGFDDENIKNEIYCNAMTLKEILLSI